MGDRAFVGCNSNLIAPVTVEAEAYIAAGSTITKEVPAGALGGAAFEAEAVDSVTGERLAAIYDSKAGSRFGVTAGLQELGHAQQVIDRWIALFGNYLDQLVEARAKRKGK